MKRFDTESLFTLGMALTSDRRTMERRVRGVFARKKSAKGAVALSLLLVLALSFAAFTTACQPGKASVSDGNAELTQSAPAETNARLSTSAETTAGKHLVVSGASTKEQAMEELAAALKTARNYPAPRMEGINAAERGSWQVHKNLDNTQREKAGYRFLEIANAVFDKSYTQDDLIDTYYLDQSGERSNVWRFDTKDGVLSGAMDGQTLAFISANCLNEPGDGLHPTLADPAQNPSDYSLWSTLDPTQAADRIAQAMGRSVLRLTSFGAGSEETVRAGYMMQPQVLITLSDGRYCSFSVFADEALTTTSVCVYPDTECATEGVFWRADLEHQKVVDKQLYPSDFREGEPGADDMTRQEAVSFYTRLFDSAGYIGLASGEEPPEPETTFYIDYSGARENYWHLEGSGIVLDLASKTKRLLGITASGNLGSNLGLRENATGVTDEDAYIEATNALFAGLFGAGEFQTNYAQELQGDYFCGVSASSESETSYDVQYHNGMIRAVYIVLAGSPNHWTSVPDWLAKWAEIDPVTGEISIDGFADDLWAMGSYWLADSVYLDQETGGIFLKTWY